MNSIVQRFPSARCRALGFVSVASGLSMLTGQAFAEDDGKWHVGMEAVFTGFLCKEPIDAVHGLVAALDLTSASSLKESQKIEEAVHCFFSDGPVRFAGRILNSKVFVDPKKGRFLFVAFDIGGGITAYSWVGEAFVSDEPMPTGDRAA